MTLDVRHHVVSLVNLNHYPADSVICFLHTYPLASDLSGGLRYPALGQVGPGVQLYLTRALTG